MAALLLAALLAWGRYFPDLLGIAALVIVVYIARRDRADEVAAGAAAAAEPTPAQEVGAAEPSPAPDAAAAGAEPAPDGGPAEPLPAPDGGAADAEAEPAPAPAPLRRSSRTLILLAMALMCGLGVVARDVYLYLTFDPGCGASHLSILRNGATVNREQCEFLTRELVAGTALITPVIVVLIALAIAEYRSARKRVWFKLPWFALIAFISSPPMPWKDNLIFMVIMVALGAGILLLIDKRMKPGGKRGAHLELPYRKIGAGAAAVVLLGGGLFVFNRSRDAKECRSATARTFDAKVKQLETVTRTLPASGKQDVLEAAKKAFDTKSTNMTAQKVVLWGDVGLGLFKFDSSTGPQLGVATIARESSEWKVEGVLNGYDTYQPLPGEADAGVFFGTRETMPPFVEPGITRVESVDRCGTVIDRDTPAEGFFMVLVTRPGLVRAFRGSMQAAAFPSINLSPRGNQSERGRESHEVAEKFAEALLEKGGDEAAKYTTREGAGDVVRSFAAGMTGRYEIDGPVQDVVLGNLRFYVFPLSFEGGSGVLAVQTADEGDGWKVLTLHMTATAQPRGPDVPSGLPDLIA